MAISLSCRVSLYADESALIASGKSLRELSEFLSADLESCRRWMVDNELSDLIMLVKPRRLFLVHEGELNV